MSPRELAAAIRKGAQLRPQGFGSALLCTDDPSREQKSCALQAAAEGATGRLVMSTDRCREALGISEWISDEIWNRNDNGQTREQIADWLDTLDVSKPKDAQTFDDFMKVVVSPVEVDLAKVLDAA